MTLREDIREHFEREAGRFPIPHGLREAVSAEAAREGSVERRAANWAAVAAAVLAVAIVAGLVAFGSLRQKAVPGVVTSPAPKATPAGPQSMATIDDIDLVDAVNGWALLERCDPTSCSYLVSRTTDGGQSWSKPVLVGQPFAAADGDAPRHIHFIDPADGFVYGHEVAFYTGDGGRSWMKTSFGPEVVDIEGRASAAWVLTRPCGKGVVCPYAVTLSIDGGHTWVPATALPDNYMAAKAVAFGARGLLIGSIGTGDMLMTTDGGASWSRLPGRCNPSTPLNYIATADGRELWQLCSAYHDAATASIVVATALFVSTDGGSTWSKRQLLPTQGWETLNPLTTLVSPARATAVLANGTYPDLVSHDSGRTWNAGSPINGFVAVTFADETTGWGRDANAAIWVTTDGGSTWRPLAAGPGVTGPGSARAS